MSTKKKHKPVLIKEKGNWKQYWDPKFQKHFFYNTITKQTEWTKPPEFMKSDLELIEQETEKKIDVLLEKTEFARKNKEFHSDLLSELRPKENRKSVQDYMSDMFDIVQEISEEKRKIDEEERRKKIEKKKKKLEILVEEEEEKQEEKPKVVEVKSPEVPILKIKSPRKSILDEEEYNTPKIEEIISPRIEEEKPKEIPAEKSQRKKFGSFLQPKDGIQRNNSMFSFLAPNTGGGSEIKKGRSISFFGNKNMSQSFTNVQSIQQPAKEKIVKKKSFLSFLSPRGNDVIKKSSKEDIHQPEMAKRKILGTSLDDLMLDPSEKYEIPIIYQKILDYLKTKTTKPKIFEKKGDPSSVDALIKEIEEKGEKFTFKTKANVHDVTELFLTFLKALPSRLVPDELVPSFSNIGKIDASLQKKSIKQFVHTVYQPTYIYSSKLFKKIIELLSAICKGTYYNQMNEYLLAKVFVPVVFGLNSKNSHEKENLENVFELMISNYKHIYMERDTMLKVTTSSKSIESLDKNTIILESNQLMEVSSKVWKEMHIVLLEKSIHVYSSNSKKNEDPVVILPLTKNTSVFTVTEDQFHPYSYCVEINGTSTIFEATSQEEREKWMKYLLNQIQEENVEDVIYSPRGVQE